MRKKPIITALLVFVVSLQSFGQSVDVDLDFDPNFAIAIIAGVIIAIGIQIFLTALSIASGITAIGDFKEMYIQNRVRNSDSETYMSIEDGDDKNQDSGNTGIKVAAGVGIWSIITLGISSFVGSLLAMNLVPVASIQMAVTIALVIWALFSLVVVYYESKLVGVIVGSIASVATSGFKMSSEMINGAFANNATKNPKKLIDHTVEKVREELKNEVNLNDLNEVVDRLVNKVDSKLPDYGTLKEDLEEILESTKTEVEANAQAKNSNGSSPMKWMTIQKVLDKATNKMDEKGGARAQKDKLVTLAKELKSAWEEGENQEESIKNVAQKISPKDEETTNKYVEQIMNFVSTESTDGINFEKLQSTFKDLQGEPKSILQGYAKKISDLNRDKAITLLEGNTNFDKEQLEQGADEIEKYVRWVNQQVISAGSKKSEMLSKMQTAVATFFNDSGRPELQYNSLKHDLDKILDDPKCTPRVVRERTEQFSTDTFIGLVTAHTSLSQEDIEKLKNEVDTTKQSVIDRMTKVESQAKGKIAQLKKKAVIQAEHTRVAAAAAAWWLVATGLISAAAAVGGAIISI